MNIVETLLQNKQKDYQFLQKYNIQFITHIKLNYELITRFEHVLLTYFKKEQLYEKDIPTVIASQLNVFINYLGSVFRVCREQNILNKIIEYTKIQLRLEQFRFQKLVTRWSLNILKVIASYL